MISKQPRIFIYCLLGLTIGIGLDNLFQYKTEYISYHCFIAAFGILYALSFNGKNLNRLMVTSIFSALTFTFPIMLLKFNSYTQPLDNPLSLFLAMPLFLYIIHCFHNAIHEESTLAFSYKRLFVAVWNTAPTLIVASIFSAIANFLIFTACSLLNYLDYSFLWNIFYKNPHINFITSVFLFFTGIGIAKERLNIINSIRFILLNMMQYLYPLNALITIVFFILFCVSSTAIQNHFLANNIILLGLTCIGIIFFNAFYQEGESQNFTNSSLALFLKFYRIILFFLSITAIQTIFLHETLSLNTSLYLFLILGYTTTYCFTVFFSAAKEQQYLYAGNITIALLFLSIILILNNPFNSIGTITVINKAANSETIRKHTVTLQKAIHSIDKNLLKAGLTWHTPDENKNNMPICRTFIAGAYQIGNYRNEHCWLSIKDKAVKADVFLVLANNNNNYTWTNSTKANRYYKKSLATGVKYINKEKPELGLTFVYSCRTIYDDKIYYGKVVNNNCSIIVNNNKISISGAQTLSEK